MTYLTSRELEILTLIGKTLANKAIASTLGIAEFTVRKHRSNIIRKMAFTSSSQLVAHAVRAEANTARSGDQISTLHGTRYGRGKRTLSG